MTVVDVPLIPHDLPRSIGTVRRILPMAACGLTAPALRDPGVAAWVRTHSVTVIVCGDDELDLVLGCGVQPLHVVLRCGPSSRTIARAATRGVIRFVVSADRHVDALVGCPQPARHVYLDEYGPAVVGERRLDVVGIHCDVGPSVDAHDWHAAVQRALSRMALIGTCKLTLTRISLAGGSTDTWLAGDAAELTGIASAVEDALDEGCAR